MKSFLNAFPLLFFANSLLGQLIINEGYLGDHMVIQHGKPFEISGRDSPGQIITFSGFGHSVSSTANLNGEWTIKVPSLIKGEIGTIAIEGSSSIEFTNIASGEVWFVVGQSNVEMSLNASDFNIEILDQQLIGDPIRIYHQPRRRSLSQNENGNGLWMPVTMKNAGKFSAIAIIFAHNLRQSIDHPIGIIVSSWGSSNLKSWLPGEHIIDDPTLSGHTLEVDKINREAWLPLYSSYLENKKSYPNGSFPRSVVVPREPHETGDLFNGMVRPFTRLPVSGIIYYQGESDVPQPKHFQKLFLPLIQAYRDSWNIPGLPFLFVQLPGWDFARQRELEIIEKEIQQFSALAEFRDVQSIISEEVQNSGMIVTIDTGDKDNIHPKDKSVLGKRLAHAALDIVYHKKILWRGPKLDKEQIHQTFDEIILEFKHVGHGIKVLGDTIKGFSIASDENEFQHAHAKVIGINQISIQKIPSIRSLTIRYAWNDFPTGNLFDSELNPAGPFKFVLRTRE